MRASGLVSQQCALLALLTALPQVLCQFPGFPPIGTFFGVPGKNASYDYVVVGAGTSGLTVANRLAEAGHSVAVIEAGSPYELTNGNLSQIPAFASDGGTGQPSDTISLVDWQYVTAPQTALNGRQIPYAQGKCLGGSSARNELAYMRGTSGSFAQWASEVNNQSFTFENLLPYFKKSADFTPPDYSKLPPGTNISYDPTVFESGGGPLHVSYSNYQQPINPYLEQGFKKLGLSLIPGFNSGNLLGYGNVVSTMDPATETRSSSETSFLVDAISKQAPMTTYIQALAKKIVFNGTQATGVVVGSAGFQYTLSATKEVIVGAGVFNTPQLLMASGIGPQAALQKLNIPVVANLAGVGQGIQDQPYYGMGFKTNVTTDSALGDPATLAAATAEFIQSQTGPLTNVGGDIIGWEKIPSKYRSKFSRGTLSDLSKFPADWPEIEILPLAAPTFPVTDNSQYASITLALLSTTSRGTVTLSSADTSVAPIISPNWLSTSTDQQVAIAGLRVARDLVAASGLQEGPEVAPGPAVQTDDQILAYIKETVYTIHHAACSCKMGLSSDPTAVVNNYGQVFGVTGLRLVDISTFPLLPPGHPQAIVYGIAEKYAADILAGH